MIGVISILHVVICLLLLAAILMQAGKGGGLAEGFNSAENLMGAQTNAVMLKITTVLGVLFLVTCLSIAIFSARKERSLMTGIPQTTQTKTVDIDKLFDQAPVQTITINAEEPLTTTAQ